MSMPQQLMAFGALLLLFSLWIYDLAARRGHYSAIGNALAVIALLCLVGGFVAGIAWGFQ